MSLAFDLPETLEPTPSLAQAIADACARIAPLWPLASFVAVNPFLGFAEMPFEAAAAELPRLAGARLTPPRAFYRRALQDGRITSADLQAGLTEPRGARLSLDALLQAVRTPEPNAPPARIPTVAEVLDQLAAGDRQVSRTAFMIDEISRWCAAYFDEGHAVWAAPWRSLPLYAAWREAVRYDRNPQVMGVADFAGIVEQLPEDAVSAIGEVLDALEAPAHRWADYLYRALFDVRGWAAYVRRLDWEAEQRGERGGRLADLLAVRVVWGYALFQRTPGVADAWRGALRDAEAPSARRPAQTSAADVALQSAYEHGYQRQLIAQLAAGPAPRPAGRPPVQAVFCIDVRSEPYRRALEAAWPGAETLGFAGFFGMPMAYRKGEAADEPHCPVLLQPGFKVSGQGGGAAGPAAKALWSRLKSSVVSSFGFVEAFGLGFAPRLAAGFGGLGRAEAPAAPSLAAEGLDLTGKINLAEGALRGMSLTGGFAPLVLIVGHGATTANNPHAAGLHCGACGGHRGDPNARFAAALLNDPAVRMGLAARGIDIPADTWFAPALHDTTTDDVWLLDKQAAPPAHWPALEEAARRLVAASQAARAERAPRLGLAPCDAGQVSARSRDWSQVRPEWGLAGAAAFVAGPRALTAGRSLDGRVFLHSYDRHADPQLKILELILTAPVVVASWISLQYYGSTVDPGAFGAGDKTLHNVCGRLGVLEGNAGDLRAGLPLQSVHDGERFVHEPLRLSVFIAAEADAMTQVLARQPAVRTLFDNRWIHLFALDDGGHATHRYAGALTWETL